MPSNWCARAPKRWAARVAAGGPTWRRLAARMAPRRMRRSRRSKKRWAAPKAHPIGEGAMRGHDLRRRIYDLLEHDNLPHTPSAHLAHAIIAIIVINVVAMVLASVPDIDSRFGR